MRGTQLRNALEKVCGERRERVKGDNFPVWRCFE